MLSSKTKWFEEGEQYSIFFLNLEKLNYSNKLITNLKVDEKIIKEQCNIAEAQAIFFHNLFKKN